MTTIDLNHEPICINPTDDLTLYDKNNVMSRIEKFLFAICSLDSSDLPIPLSRIEELYNCLVTGDTPPTFEPLSRAEKFLMACLGGYDINKLPEPLSRSEVLLKKIATGDNNLEDVDNLQSKYEFLLAYIIQNGGIGGIGGDISYMKYTLTEKETTLYNTKKRSVRSAILKGQTLVNLARNFKYQIGWKDEYEWGEENTQRCCYNVESAKSNTKYLIKNFNETTQAYIRYYGDSNRSPLSTTSWIGLPAIITTPTDTKKFSVSLRISDNNEEYISPDQANKNLVVEYQDGMENWDIPYFEGMVSVKMPVLTTVGKNLLLNTNDTKKVTNVEPTLNYEDGGFNFNITEKLWQNVWYDLNLKPNIKYTISYQSNYMDCNIFKSKVNTYVSTEVVSMVEIKNKSEDNLQLVKLTFTSPSNGFVRIRLTNGYLSGHHVLTNLQLEEGSTVTEYEPYKSNILTCNEEVTLRGIGDVRDTLDLTTGEYTKAIYEYTFTGDENWKLNGGANGGYTYFSCNMGGLLVNYDYKTTANIPISCNRLPVITYNDFDNKLTSVGVNLTYFFRLNFSDCNSNNGATVEDLKAYLKANPTTVQYPISKSVKTVDLSTLDQDGNNTNLSSFNDITYVTLSSEGLIPEAELEVATKNEEVLNTLSLEMEDISTAQTTLEETSNTQSENVDATMIATTEIYEGLL